jgi:aquaporin Z
MTPKLLAEAIGTFALVLTIGLVSGMDFSMAPVAIGTVLMAVVYAGRSVSGAHYNPAVTVSIWLRGALPASAIAPYVAAQCVGAFLAAFLTYKFVGVPLHVAPAEGVSALKALTGEGIFTFVLAYVILNVETAKATEGNGYFGLAFGGTVMAGAFAMGDITGAAFNPAVGLMPALFEVVIGRAVTPLAWVYLIGPVAGGIAAAYVFKAMHPGE